MPTLAKIPQEEKKTGAMLCGRYAIFCKGFLKATTIASNLAKLDNKDGIPEYGWITFKKKRIYYCHARMIENSTIYSKD